MPFSSYGYRSISRSAIDNEVPLYLSAANKQAASRVAPGAADGGADVFADEVRQEHAGGKIFRAGHGPAEAPVWDFVVTSSGITGLPFYDKGGAIVNAKAYSPTGNPADVGANQHNTNDSTALEAAVADAKQLSYEMWQINGQGRLLQIHVPAGKWNLTRTWDLDGLTGCRITGDGYESTVLGINQGTGANDDTWWSQKSMVSMCGNDFCRIEGMSITPDNLGATQPVPECGLLVASNSPFTNWLGFTQAQNNANRIEHYSLRVAGAFRKAAHVNFANVSSVYQSCDFSRDKSANPAAAATIGTNANQACIVFTRDNQVGVHQSGSVPLIDPSSMEVSCSDLTLVDVETHDRVHGGASGASCVCPCVWFDEVYDANVQGGNWSCHASGAGSCGYVRFSPGARYPGSPGSNQIGCRNITFDNIYFSNEGGGLSSQFLCRQTGNLADDALILRSRIQNYPNDSDTYAIASSDIVFRNCRVCLDATFPSGLVGGGRSDQTAGVAYFIRWRLENVSTYSVVSGNVRINEDNLLMFGGMDGGVFLDCEFDAYGMPLTAFAPNASMTLTGGHLRRPGTLTGNITISQGEFDIVGGGAVALPGGATAYYGQTAHATRASVVPIRITQSCWVFNLRTVTDVAPGASKTLTATLHKASPSTGISWAATPLQAITSGTSLVGANSSTFVRCDAGDVLLVEVVSLAASAANNWFSWSLAAIPTWSS